MALLQATGLWEKTSKLGKKYLSGDLNRGVFIYIYENPNMKTPGSPTHLLYFASDRLLDSKEQTKESMVSDYKKLYEKTCEELLKIFKKKSEKISGGSDDWFFNQAD
jgi:hypothetical protein